MNAEMDAQIDAQVDAVCKVALWNSGTRSLAEAANIFEPVCGDKCEEAACNLNAESGFVDGQDWALVQRTQIVAVLPAVTGKYRVNWLQENNSNCHNQPL